MQFNIITVIIKLNIPNPDKPTKSIPRYNITKLSMIVVDNPNKTDPVIPMHKNILNTIIHILYDRFNVSILYIFYMLNMDHFLHMFDFE